jgi:hypothetical protein
MLDDEGRGLVTQREGGTPTWRRQKSKELALSIPSRVFKNSPWGTGHLERSQPVSRSTPGMSCDRTFPIWTI